jgi:hypothetical protein
VCAHLVVATFVWLLIKVLMVIFFLLLDRRVCGVLGQEGGSAVPSVRPHVRLRQLRRPHEEVRPVQGADRSDGALHRLLRRNRYISHRNLI